MSVAVALRPVLEGSVSAVGGLLFGDALRRLYSALVRIAAFLF